MQSLFRGTPAESVCRDFFQADIEAAKLSRSFKIYYGLRPYIPIALRQLLQRRRNLGASVPRNWYLPLAFSKQIESALSQSATEIIHPWPDGKQYAFVLTHDVETAEGMRLIPNLAEIEQDLGFRSSWNIVPHKYPVDRGLLAELRQRGFEIGVHGYNHDGKLFHSKKIFQDRAKAIAAALQEYEAVGFRTPMVHRHLEWMQELPVEYDSSCFDVDPFQAMPGGVGVMWPFMAGRFVELPYTMPQDHTLLVALGETTDRIWQAKLQFIKRWSGMALMLTHPDYLETETKQNIYRSFLESVRENDDYWHALPRDTARWWKRRENSHLLEENQHPTITGPAFENGKVAALTNAGFQFA